MMKTRLCPLTFRSLNGLLGALILASAVPAAPRPLELGDYDRMQAVADPVCSADGRWVLYTVQSVDVEADEQRSGVWMVSTQAHPEPLRVSAPDRSAQSPRFSPDGRYVSFLATRANEDKAQLLLLDRRGGEAQPLTAIKGSVREYDWAPDGRHLVLSIARQASEGEAAHPGRPAPIVIDSLHFKEDQLGYLTGADRPRLYLYDLESGRLDALTTERDVEDSLPTFSSDGGLIAFVRERGDAARTG